MLCISLSFSIFLQYSSIFSFFNFSCFFHFLYIFECFDHFPFFLFVFLIFHFVFCSFFFHVSFLFKKFGRDGRAQAETQTCFWCGDWERRFITTSPNLKLVWGLGREGGAGNYLPNPKPSPSAAMCAQGPSGPYEIPVLLC